MGELCSIGACQGTRITLRRFGRTATDLGDPELTPELRARIVDGVTEAAAVRPSREISAQAADAIPAALDALGAGPRICLLTPYFPVGQAHIEEFFATRRQMMAILLSAGHAFLHL